MEELNKKGFTLVELLAVIVVLAIIIIIAVPAVLDSTDKAKESAFRVYAKKMVIAAQNKRGVEELTGNPSNCWKIADLEGNTSGKYSGTVSYNTTSKVYSIQMKDNSYSINADFNAIDTTSLGAATATIKTTCS